MLNFIAAKLNWFTVYVKIMLLGSIIVLPYLKYSVRLCETAI